MPEIMFRRIAPILICCCAILAGCATPASKEDMQAVVSSAEKTLKNFHADPDMNWFRTHAKNARAIIVAPNVVKAGFIFGGSGGEAVALAHGQTKSAWAGPAFYTLGAATVGFQAGVEASEVVMLVMSEKAFNSILSSSFKLGADVSVAAGPVGAGATAPITADIVVYSRSKGLYGGLNLEGSVLTVNHKANEAYFGPQATPVDILVKRSVSNPNAASLLKTVGQVTR